jgi:hypothetical protein
LPYETILATVINHAELLHRHSETLAAQAFPAGQLDKLKRAIIDHAARSPRLDSEELQNHLRSLGFSAALDGLLARTGSSKWTLPTAGLDQAEEGLLHVMGVLRERNEVRGEIDEAAHRLQESMSDEDWERMKSRQVEVLEGESRRNDLDRDPPGRLTPGGAQQSKVG